MYPGAVQVKRLRTINEEESTPRRLPFRLLYYKIEQNVQAYIQVIAKARLFHVAEFLSVPILHKFWISFSQAEFYIKQSQENSELFLSTSHWTERWDVRKRHIKRWGLVAHGPWHGIKSLSKCSKLIVDKMTFYRWHDIVYILLNILGAS